DGGMALHRRERRLHHHVSVSARWARRFLWARGAGVAAPRTVPARVRRQDLARKSRIAAPDEPLFRDPQGRGVIGFHPLVPAKAGTQFFAPAPGFPLWRE